MPWLYEYLILLKRFNFICTHRCNIKKYTFKIIIDTELYTKNKYLWFRTSTYIIFYSFNEFYLI